MESAKGKNVLVSGASIAGLATAYWLTSLGYTVTIVERAAEFRTGGSAVNIGGLALDVAGRMGILESLKTNALSLERYDFKNEDDTTAVSTPAQQDASDTEIEIERDKLIAMLFDAVKDDVAILFGNSITALVDTTEAMLVTFSDGSQRTFELVIGCDGLHSGVRHIWFGPEADYSHFLSHYFSLTIVNKLLIEPNTMQLYNVPGKVIMLNAYNQKTDIVFCFSSEHEIPYDYRNTEQQQAIILNQFAGQGWRSTELLDEIKQAGTAYFDKFAQIRMPSWTKGRVALVGDAGYCASPAAGSGGSLALIGAAAIADALEQHNGQLEPAFQAYNQALRPFIEDVQASALTMLSTYLIPGTEAAIRERNTQANPFQPA